jgi:hypothetical protein
MTRSTSSIMILCFCAFAIFADVIFADQQSDKTKEDWSPISVGPIVTDTGVVCVRNQLIVQPYFFYNRARGSFNDDGSYKSYINKDKKSQYQEQLLLQYGITDRLQVDGQGVYQQNLKEVNGQNAESTGFGDSYLTLHYRFLEDKLYMPQVAGFFQLKIPTGKFQKADEGKLGTDLMGAITGGGSYEHSYGVTLTKKMKPFVFYADAIYNFPIARSVNDVNTKYGFYTNYDASVEYFLPKGFSLMLEINGLWQGDRRGNGALVPGSDQYSLVLGTGIGWSCKRVQTLLAYQRTLAGTNVDVNDSLVFTFACPF